MAALSPRLADTRSIRRRPRVVANARPTTLAKNRTPARIGESDRAKFMQTKPCAIDEGMLIARESLAQNDVLPSLHAGARRSRDKRSNVETGTTDLITEVRRPHEEQDHHAGRDGPPGDRRTVDDPHHATNSTPSKSDFQQHAEPSRYMPSAAANAPQRASNAQRFRKFSSSSRRTRARAATVTWRRTCRLLQEMREHRHCSNGSGESEWRGQKERQSRHCPREQHRAAERARQAELARKQPGAGHVEPAVARWIERAQAVDAALDRHQSFVDEIGGVIVIWQDVIGHPEVRKPPRLPPAYGQHNERERAHEHQPGAM